MPISCWLDDCSFTVSFETKICDSSNFFFLFKIILAILHSLYFYKIFRISLSSSAEEQAGILIGSTLNLY